MDSDFAIKVSHVSKRYTIGAQKDGSLRGSLASFFKSSASKGEEFWAVKDVSFQINKGSVIGIIGKNGAGKSTLLKILSQITKPTTGKIEINGRVASLLEVGTGFHPELTGRENIFLNGTILGMTRKEVKAKFDEIVIFSGVEKFIDTQVKHYSSGMYVRLAFAVAAHLEPEILIIDEVLAVGDAEFQKKCLGKMKEVASHGRTVLFVSHNLTAVKELCPQSIFLHDGEINFYGDTVKAIDNYRNQSRKGRLSMTFDEGHEIGNESIKILGYSISSLTNSESITIDSGVKLKMHFQNHLDSINLATSMFLINEEDLIISEIACIVSEDNDSKVGQYEMEVLIPANTLNSGTYIMNVIFAENQRHIILSLENIFSFEISNKAIGNTYTRLPGVLSLSGHAVIKQLN